MFFTAQMRYLQIVVLEKDFHKTIDLLADFGWIEIKSGKDDKDEKIVKITENLNTIEEKIYDILDFLGIPKSENKGVLKNISDIDEFFSMIRDKITPYKDKINELEERKKDLENGLKEIDQFKELKVTKEELNALNFLYFTIGSLVAKDLEILKENMKGRLAYIALGNDLYILFTSKKGRWTLQSELKKIHFKERKIPFENDVLPAEVYQTLMAEIQRIDAEIVDIDNFKKQLIDSQGTLLSAMVESFNLQKVYQDINQSINHSGSTTIIEGWVKQKKVKEVVDKIHDLLGNTVSIISRSPDEIDEVVEKKLKVPVIMENRFIFKHFEKIVFNYGAPPYGTLDPTIFVTVSFLMLFGLMFGDMGQGLLILLVGLAAKYFKPFKKIKDVGPILISVGISAMIFGYLYGAAFCFEYEHLEPVLRPINRTLFGIDKPYIIHISLHDLSTIIDLFKLTVGFGIVINLLGILVNVINNFIMKKIGEALFSRTGLAGFIMLFCVAVILLQLLVLETKPTSIFIIIAVVSVVFILLKEPLSNIIHRKKKMFDHGIGMWLLHSVVEFIEIILSTMSNNLSFIRVGAFAFAHVLLSVTTLTLAEALGGSLTSPSAIGIIIFGNLFITVLEGMIVSIQTIRLEYYEFFSKFFIELGREFKPFKIEKNKMEDIL